MASPYPGPNATRQQIARWMAEHAIEAGLPPELPVMAGLVESGLRNLSYGDRDSLGFFQMRRSIWDQGPYKGYAQNPELQLRWFIDQAKKANRGANLGEWVANIERPAEQYRGRYQQRLAEARALVKGLGGAGVTDATPATPPSNEAQASATGGRFSRFNAIQPLLARNAKLAGIPEIRIPDSIRLRVEVDDDAPAPPQAGAPAARQGSAAPPPPDQIGQAIVQGAKQFLGVKYVWGGESLEEGGFDCSGLVQHVLGKLGIKTPRVSQDQFRSGQPVPPEQAQAGDLVFFKSSGSANAPGHVGIALGDGRYIHAPRTGDVVKISSLADRSDLVGVRRYR